MLPPFYGIFIQNEDVMTSNKCLKYNQLEPTINVLNKNMINIKKFQFSIQKKSVYNAWVSFRNDRAHDLSH